MVQFFVLVFRHPAVIFQFGGAFLMIIHVNVKYFFSFTAFFPSLSIELCFICTTSAFRTCPCKNMVYHSPARDLYTRVHFNFTRRVLSAQIQDPAAAPAADKIPAPVPDRPAPVTVPDNPGLPAMAQERHGRSDSLQDREIPEQGEEAAPEVTPTGNARKEAEDATPRAERISINQSPRKKTPKVKLKWKAPSAPYWQEPCSRCAFPTGTKCWPIFPAKCANALLKSW